MAWLQLIRWKNLIIILLTQLLIWLCIILPLHPEVLDVTGFCCIAISTVLIAAAGYIINDYFDVKIDLINRPDKVILEKAIPRKRAIVLHIVLNIVAIMFANYPAVKGHHPEWLNLQLCCAVLLWFYSTHFKRQPFSGNIVVSLLTALTILTLVLYEPVITSPIVEHTHIVHPVWILLFYAYFAFMLTWMREIVKDMEDLIGDEADGCRTIPVKYGLSFSANFTLGISACVILSLVAAVVFLFSKQLYLLPVYLLLFLVAPLVVWSVNLRKKFTTEHYANASRWLKVIMITGVCSLIVYQFLNY